MFKLKLSSLTLASFIGAATLLPLNANAALIFNFGAGTGDAQADAGFQRAADFLSSTFEDNITVNIDSGFSNLGGSTLGQAGSTQTTYGFTNWKTAMGNDQTSADDATMVSNLPGGPNFSLYINRTSNNPNGSSSATPYVDNDGGNNNSQVRLTNANAKALGLLAANNAASDATITFNNQFTWDFDPTDGIDVGAIDFVGVAIHELMHAMGFISGVDILDINSPGSSGPFSDNAFTFVSGLDFTRFSDDSITAGADIDWTADTRNKLFSIDGGTTTLIADAWSTGVTHGDGRQASHWRDGLGIGIMDPTSAPAGSANVVTGFDIQALDVIGWNLFTNNTTPTTGVPTPAVWMLMLSGLLLMARRRT